MAQNQFLAAQLSGPYAQALMAAVEKEILLASPEINYMYSMNINNYVSQLLTTAGELVGWLWPLVPSGLAVSGGHLFTFYSAASGYVNPHFVTYSGFGSVISGTTLSGLLSSVYASSQIGASVYAQLLPIAAKIKYGGLTFANVDAACQVFGPHTITIMSGINVGDIKVVFNPDISALQLNVANQLMVRFATEPQVLLYNV